MIPKYLDKCDMILLMTVHPGFGGQAFMPEVLEKIKFTRRSVRSTEYSAGGLKSDGGLIREHGSGNVSIDRS